MKLPFPSAFAALLAAGCASSPGPPPFQSPDSPSLTGKTTFPPDMGRGASRSETEVTMMYLPVEIQHSCDGTDPKFTFDSSGVVGTDNGSLRNLAACMKDGALKNRSIRIIGHADARGSETYNDKLGKRRAESVKLTLEKMGVSPERLLTVTDGKLGASLPTEDWDRRVDFEVVQ
jgi:peptidoglycan-associated lipoprotein